MIQHIGTAIYPIYSTLLSLIGDENNEVLYDGQKDEEDKSYTMARLLAEKQTNPVQQSMFQEMKMEKLQNECNTKNFVFLSNVVI